MPSLLDLAPELIDQIHLEHEQLLLREFTHEEQHKCVGIPTKLGSFRLTNRTLFAAVAGSDTEATHIVDDVSGALVPAAYLRNKEALLEAFRACVNVIELWFVNRPLDVKPMERYKRESRGIEPFVGVGDGDANDEDDDEDDSDESDSDDVGDDGQGSEDGTEDEDEDEDENEVEEEGEDEGEDDAHVNSDAQEDENDGNENHVNSEIGPPRAVLYDIISTYNYVLLLAGQADLCPRRIMTAHTCSDYHCVCTKIGLTDCAGLSKASSALKKLEVLKLNFIQEQHAPIFTLEGVGARLSKQTTEAFAHMPVLERLELDFHLCNSPDAWRILAKAPLMPTLDLLHLDSCSANIHDFTEFIGKHMANWKLVAVGSLHLTNGSVRDLTRLYEMLSTAPKLEAYAQRSLILGGAEHEHATLPLGICYPISAVDENEDGFIEVVQTEWIRWKGHDEVTEVLGVLARHLLDELRLV